MSEEWNGIESAGDHLWRLKQDNARLEAENRALREALEWYAEHAASIAAHLPTGSTDAVMAAVHTLALDGGRRAGVALERELDATTAPASPAVP